MLNEDDILQNSLTELENGQPLERVIASLPTGAAGLEPLIRLAAAVRAMPHPELGVQALHAQRQRVLAAARLHETQPLPPSRFARRPAWKWLGGAAALAAGSFLVLFFVLAAGLGIWLNHQRQDTARVETIVGQVQVSRDREGSAWKNLEVGDRIRQGQRLRTLGASYAALVFSEGSRTFLAANADLAFTQLDLGAGKNLQVEMFQGSGDTWHQVTPLQSENSYFLVRTPSGTASVHGTSFNVKVSQSGLAHFAVDTGQVQVSSNGRAVTLLAGQATAAHPGGEIEPPTYQFGIQGSLLEKDETSGVWNVSGMEFQVTAATAVAGDPQLGDEIAVTGRILPDGSRAADTIQPASGEQAAFFTGLLEHMAAGEGTWVIGGVEVQVSPETELDDALQTGQPVKVTFNILQDQTWLALKIEALVEEPAEPEPTPSATADPDAMPSYEFDPDELETDSCAGSSTYTLTGTLRNTADESKDYAANVRLDYLIDRGGEYVSAVTLDPAGWDRLEVGQTVRFNVQVTMSEAWASAPVESEVKLLIYIASATNRPDHLNGRLTVTIMAGCIETTPTVPVTPTVTVTPIATLTPGLTPTGTATAAATETGLCTGANPHPTGLSLAQRYAVTYEEIMHWFCDFHYGFGEIDLAYSLSRSTGKPVEEIFAMRASGMGWGNIKQELEKDHHDEHPDGKKDKDRDRDKKDKKDRRDD